MSTSAAWQRSAGDSDRESRHWRKRLSLRAAAGFVAQWDVQDPKTCSHPTHRDNPVSQKAELYATGVLRALSAARCVLCRVVVSPDQRQNAAMRARAHATLLLCRLKPSRFPQPRLKSLPNKSDSRPRSGPTLRSVLRGRSGRRHWQQGGRFEELYQRIGENVASSLTREVQIAGPERSGETSAEKVFVWDRRPDSTGRAARLV
ncbi:hypothetical protein L209DRAFT_65904 [Thermothelomyces heterothallicus CBS 203.75]